MILALSRNFSQIIINMLTKLKHKTYKRNITITVLQHYSDLSKGTVMELELCAELLCGGTLLLKPRLVAAALDEQLLEWA